MALINQSVLARDPGAWQPLWRKICPRRSFSVSWGGFAKVIVPGCLTFGVISRLSIEPSLHTNPFWARYYSCDVGMPRLVAGAKHQSGTFVVLLRVHVDDVVEDFEDGCSTASFPERMHESKF